VHRYNLHMEPQHTNPSLKIRQITEQLRESIIDGVVRVGEQLPPEPELMARYGVSRSTLREAVASLVHEGLLRRVHGKGTYVSELPPSYRTIAVSMPYLFFGPASPFSAGTEVIPRLVQSIEEEARRSDISMMLYLNNNNAEIERANLERILARQVDGVILTYIGGSANVDCLHRIQETGIPMVMIDLYEADLNVDVVTTDNDAGAYQATRQMVEAGFDTVHFMTSPVINSALRERRAGYERAMAERGLRTNIVTLNRPTTSFMSEEERAYITAREVLPGWHEQSFGVLTADAPIAAGLWEAISETDLPYDRFALACFDEPFLHLPRGVRLIKVMQPLQEIGRLSVERLQIKEGNHSASSAGLKPRIIRLAPRFETTGFSPSAS
jgi:DNA-binding LacI/PurR family transcriptional regulator